MKGIYLIAIATIFLTSWDVIRAEEEFDEIPIECPAEDPKDRRIHLAHETDCTKFYVCENGEKIVQQCPPYNKEEDRLHFNPRSQVCDWPDKAGCVDKNPGEDCSCEDCRCEQQLVAPNEEFIAKKDHKRATYMVYEEIKCPDRNPNAHNTTILLPHENDCTKFYMCLGRQKIGRNCPYMNPKGDRLHFNPQKNVCDWPDQAGCEPASDCDDGRLLPNPCNCSQFYECVNGNKILRECPDGLYFSETDQGCGKFEDSACEKRKTYNCTREGEKIPHECDCDRYYLCRKDDQVLRWCEDGLEFSPEHRRCEDPAIAGCSRPKPGPGDCPRPPPEYPWRHECDCRLFYKCENGKKRLYECPWGYYFDEKNNICLPEERVTDCKNRWDD